ncbi:type II toxin-antitoxin system death-on-curing family toxin [Candidatus Saccharibacteria bacterium]|nr:type II toxin-antitoxin system death-on-curing family toxin [Candidatus Saccharibacteria bacterium]
MKRLSIGDVQYIAHALAVEWMQFDEPLPDFETRYPGRLESCIEQPFQTYEGVELYEGLAAKAAMLFYLIIKNHPFENGNKRMAVTITVVFLVLNGKFVKATPHEMYKAACLVAESKSEEMDKHITVLIGAFQEYLMPLSELKD